MWQHNVKVENTYWQSDNSEKYSILKRKYMCANYQCTCTIQISVDCEEQVQQQLHMKIISMNFNINGPKPFSSFSRNDQRFMVSSISVKCNSAQYSVKPSPVESHLQLHSQWPKLNWCTCSGCLSFFSKPTALPVPIYQYVPDISLNPKLHMYKLLSVFIIVTSGSVCMITVTEIAQMV